MTDWNLPTELEIQIHSRKSRVYDSTDLRSNSAKYYDDRALKCMPGRLHSETSAVEHTFDTLGICSGGFDHFRPSPPRRRQATISALR